MSVLTFDRFTPQAQVALVAAQKEALRLGYSTVETEHLLFGLLSLHDGMAMRVFQRLGLERENLLNAVTAAFHVSDPREGSLLFSSGVKNVLKSAADEMIHLGCDHVGVEHLFLGLLREDDSFVHSLLYRPEMTLDTVRAEIVSIYAQVTAERAQSVEAASLPEDNLSDATLTDATSALAPVILDSVRQQQAIQFSRRQQVFSLLYFLTLLFIIILVVVVLTESPFVSVGLGKIASVLANTPVLNWQPVVGWVPLLVLFYSYSIIVPFMLISTPFIWYIGFFIPRRYGLLKDTPLDWKSFGMSLLFFLFGLGLLVEVVTLLIIVQPQTWWAWIMLIQFLYALLMGSFSLKRRYSRLYTIEPLSDTELNRRLQVLLTRLHIPTCSVCVLKISHRSNGANAFFSGWGKERRIVLTNTLMQDFTHDEIEVILAHELAHFVHHDIWKRMLVSLLAYPGFYYLLYLLYFVYYKMHLGTDPDGRFLHYFFTMSILLGILIALAIFSNIVHYYYRYQEYQADEFALQATGKVQAFKNAMTHLTDKNLLVAAPSLRMRRASSHPTLVERLQHADKFAARSATSVQI